MIVISFGIQKSGSSLAFEMAKAVLELNGYPQVRLPDGIVEADLRGINQVGHWTDEVLSRLVEHTAGTKIVVRTHGHPHEMSVRLMFDYVIAGDLKIHVVYRDPRDTVLSMLDEAPTFPPGSPRAAIRTVDDAIALLPTRILGLRRWGRFPSLKLLYDDFAFDRVRGPELVGQNLGFAVDPDEVWRMVDQAWTRKNAARPRRYLTDMAPADAARIKEAFPDYVQLVEHGDPRWFVQRD